MSCADIQVDVVSPVDQVAALWMLFAPHPPAVRRERVASLLQAAADFNVDFRCLLEARRGHERIGVAWGQTLPGRTANVWPPRLAPGISADVADLLQEELDQRLAQGEIILAQALLPATEVDQAACLIRQGYSHPAQLLYLLSQVEQFPETNPTADLEFQPWHDADVPLLKAVIEQTYIDSQDAPSLDGWRTLDDVLEGYRGTGRFDPKRWFLVRRDSAAVGCLLLTDHPGPRHWELIYMGLIPAARGRGWGREMIRFAQWQTQLSGRELLLVSVDAANTPAIAAYARCGFSELDRREVWAKKLERVS